MAVDDVLRGYKHTRLRALTAQSNTHSFTYQLRLVACDHPKGPEQGVEGGEHRRHVGLTNLPAARYHLN